METKERVGVERRWFTVHEYHRMGEIGIFHENDRVELMDGEVVEMNPIGSRHFASVNALNRLLTRTLGDEYIVSVQNPIRFDENREPQPDLAVIRNRDYRASLPTPEDALLLIEVSDTTLAYDKNIKLPLYAKAGIPEVWIVDLEGREVERHTEPTEAGYRRIEKRRSGETVESTVVNGISIPVDMIL